MKSALIDYMTLDYCINGIHLVEYAHIPRTTRSTLA